MKMYFIQNLIKDGKWDELKRNVIVTDETIEDSICAIEDYPGQMTECSIDEFSDEMRFDDFDGYNIEAVSQFWYDGAVSDLSMECIFSFEGRKLKSITLEQIHVF